MGGSVAFTSEELYSGENPAIIASAQAENCLAECLPFVLRKRSLSECSFNPDVPLRKSRLPEARRATFSAPGAIGKLPLSVVYPGAYNLATVVDSGSSIERPSGIVRQKAVQIHCVAVNKDGSVTQTAIGVLLVGNLVLRLVESIRKL